jgi:hypothetical protein
MKNLWLIAAVICCSLSASAQNSESPDTSGNAFLRLCSAVDKENKTSTEWMWVTGCTGFVSGFTDGVKFGTQYAEDKAGKKVPGLFCLPGEVENGQIIRIILKYIRDHPEEAHQPTSFLLVDALRRSFPCRSK